MCALAALANLGKADIISAQELPNGRLIVHNDENTTIGSGEEQVKTPWMIVSPDGTRGFANDFTTNAISLVSEDGTNFYAHVEGVREVNGELQPDRTKVIQFTVNKDGIPSKTGERYSILNNDSMENKRLIGSKNQFLYFFELKNKSISYSLKTNKSQRLHPVFGEDDDAILAASSQNGSDLYILLEDNKTAGDLFAIGLYKLIPDGTMFYPFGPGEAALTHNSCLTVIKNKLGNTESYVGNVNGEILKNLSLVGEVATLPGPISGLSNNGDEVFATSTKTNAFYNVTAGQYNVAKDEDGNLKPMVPKTKEGLLRIIDNRKKNGKFLCVTAKGIHAIE